MSMSTQSHTKKWILKKLKKISPLYKAKEALPLANCVPACKLSQTSQGQRGSALVPRPCQTSGTLWWSYFPGDKTGKTVLRSLATSGYKKPKGCSRVWNSTFSNSDRASLQLYFLCRVISSCNLFTSTCNCRTSSVFWYSFYNKSINFIKNTKVWLKNTVKLISKK